MFGSFSDNQPDYSWIQTLETKESNYWFAPLKGMKGVKMVNENAVIDLEVRHDSLFTAINVTSARDSAVISLYNGNTIIFESVEPLSPDTLYIHAMELPAAFIMQALNLSNFMILIICPWISI